MQLNLSLGRLPDQWAEIFFFLPFLFLVFFFFFFSSSSPFHSFSFSVVVVFNSSPLECSLLFLLLSALSSLEVRPVVVRTYGER